MNSDKESNASNAGDDHLLYGILAMQMDFITREDLIAATSAWVKDKSSPLSQLLLERGMIDPAVHDLLQSLLLKHLERHDHDARKSLASLSSIGSVREDLRSISDSELQASLGYVAAATDARTAETLATEPGQVSPGSRYRVLRPHARGGLGEVFVARDDELHRDVALKQIKREYASEVNSRARFTMEAEITGRLEHPGVVPVYGLGADSTGCPFYVMRFIQGDSLKEAIQRFYQPSPPTSDSQGDDSAASSAPRRNKASQSRRQLHRDVAFRQLLGRFVDVCDAIQYAHSRGVLHRDLKPGNIMLGRYGETLVVDWGLAKLTGHRAQSDGVDEATLHSSSGSDSSLTQMGQAVGTPQYMSPEQAAGKMDEIGTASDVYSLGATLYCVLTGRPPFPEPGAVGTGELLRQVQRGDFPPPRSRCRAIPPALEAICLKAMALEPSKRYASPRELADDVERWLADSAVQVYRNPMYRMRLWLKNHRTAVAAVCVTLLLVAASLAFFGSRSLRVNREIDQHVLQAEMLIAAGDLDHGQAELAVAETLAADVSARSHWQTEVADRQKKLTQYEQFLKRSRTARFYIPDGITSFSRMRESQPRDHFADLCRTALNEYRVLEDSAWQEPLDARLFSAAQLEGVRDEVGELLVYLALRTAFNFEENEEGHRTTREALAMLDRAESLIPVGPGVNTLRMLWNRRIGEDDKADAAGDRGVEAAKQQATQPHVVDQYVLAQTTQEILKNPQAAIAIYLRLLKLRPDHFRAQHALFDCYRQLGDIDGQRRHLEACIALDPKNSTLNYFRGMTFFEAGDHRRAFEDFDASVKKDDDFAIGYYYRGRMHVVFGDWRAADEDFTQAIARDADFDSAFQWRAIARGKLGRYEEAVSDAEKALELSPDSKLTHFYAARAVAQAAGAALADSQHAPRAAELAEHYKQRAVEVIQNGIELGFDDFTRLVPGGDFTPVYDSPDYRRIVEDAIDKHIAQRESELADQQGDEKQQLELAEWYLARVEMRTGAEPPEEADIATLDKSFKILVQLVQGERQRRAAARLVSRVQQRKGELLDRLDRPDDAAAAWKTMALLDKATPESVAVDRAHNLAHWGRHARAVKLFEEQPDSPELSGGHCYNAARVFALAAAAADADAELDEDQRARLTQEYADRALEYLRRARDLQYFEKDSVREHVQRDTDLDVLRERQDFQQLLAPAPEQVG